ncbi:PEP-CTERM sorting domain-containing protein [Microcystis aeruginosa]|nr:PEP-CTERM sorting domain-containing protein [Microcystis aeruginosa]
MLFFISKAMMYLKTSLAGAAVAIGLTALAYPAQAAQFSFSYNDPGNSISFSGILTGTLTGNIIEITGFSDLIYGGVPLDSPNWQDDLIMLTAPAALPFDTTLASPGAPAPWTGMTVASFDGSVMNFLLIDNMSSDNIGIGLWDLDNDPMTDPVLAFTSSLMDTEGYLGPITGNLGGNLVAFDPSMMMWEAALIPEPSAVVGLLGLGLGALASKVRKKG